MAIAAKDYYRVLGVAPDADSGSVERAYRELMLELDEDIEALGDAEELLQIRQEVVEAYQVLSDPSRRADYDSLRSEPEWWCEFDDADMILDERGDEPDASSFLDVLLRRFLSGVARSGGQEIVDLLLPFEVAALGGNAQLVMPIRAACSRCGGTGGEAGQALPCAECRGEAADRGSCPSCGGRGWTVVQSCSKCGGDGWVAALGQRSLSIPSGISDGTLLPFPGFSGTESAEIEHPKYIRVRVSRHPFFTRDGHDVRCRVPLSKKTARDGKTILVRTLRGVRRPVTVPPDTHDGTIVRLEGEGIESEGQRGDQLVEFTVKFHRKKAGGKQ